LHSIHCRAKRGLARAQFVRTSSHGGGEENDPRKLDASGIPRKQARVLRGTVRAPSACVYRADLVVEEIVIVEVKAKESNFPVHGRQMLTYLRVADLPAGLVLNFGLPTMKEGITRVLNGFPS
jgi:GxxExxY protein